jgi:hypothetical protein
MVIIRFAKPRGIDPYLHSMIHDSFMSRANSIVIQAPPICDAADFNPVRPSARRAPAAADWATNPGIYRSWALRPLMV